MSWLFEDIRWRKLRATWRDTRLLLMQFRWPLLGFCLAISGGGFLYYRLAQTAGEPPDNLVEALYHVLGLTFLQPIEDFPKAWFLEAFYFVMPLVGVGILAHGVSEFGVLFFNRRARGKEWEMAVASTYSDHIVVVGLGHLGYRVVSSLYEMNQDVVVIEQNPNADLVSAVRAMGIPVLDEDATRPTTLEAAGVKQARSIIVCTQNDSLNLQVALKARSYNPHIHVTLRIFDDDFAQALQDQFGFHAMSATGMAAHVFAGAAAGVDITRPITVEGQALSLMRLVISPVSRLAGLTVSSIEGSYEVSVVLLCHEGEQDLHPAGDRRLSAGDTLAVLGGPAEIRELMIQNSTRR